MEATMAQRVSVELEDDLDGGPADETLRFGIGGAEYEIDLSKKNASKFRRQIAPEPSSSSPQRSTCLTTPKPRRTATPD